MSNAIVTFVTINSYLFLFLSVSTSPPSHSFSFSLTISCIYFSFYLSIYLFIYFYVSILFSIVASDYQSPSKALLQPIESFTGTWSFRKQPAAAAAAAVARSIGFKTLCSPFCVCSQRNYFNCHFSHYRFLTQSNDRKIFHDPCFKKHFSLLFGNIFFSFTEMCCFYPNLSFSIVVIIALIIAKLEKIALFVLWLLFIKISIAVTQSSKYWAHSETWTHL